MRGWYNLTATVTLYPTNLAEIKKLYTKKIGILNESQTYIFEKVDNLIQKRKLPGSVTSNESEMELIDLYRKYRTWITFSEGLNKLWTVVEFHEQISANPLKLDKFGIGFSNSSMIPNLHYANIAFLVSYLTALGIVPVRKCDKEFFLIRQLSTYEAVSRSEYLKQNKLKAKSQNWHEVIISVSGDISLRMKTGLTLDGADCIRKTRNYLDYSLLATSTLLVQLGNRYIGRALSVTSSLASSIFDLLANQLGLKSQNNSEDRYDQLISACNKLATSLKEASSFITLEGKIPCLANLK